MANGATARVLFPETASSVAVANADEPAGGLPFDPHFGGAEGWIDAIVPAPADTFAQAVREIRSGRLTDQTRLQGGDLLGRLVVLQSTIGEREFVDIVRRAGRSRVGLSEAVIGDIVAAVGQVALAASETN